MHERYNGYRPVVKNFLPPGNAGRQFIKDTAERILDICDPFRITRDKIMTLRDKKNFISDTIQRNRPFGLPLRSGVPNGTPEPSISRGNLQAPIPRTLSICKPRLFVELSTIDNIHPLTLISVGKASIAMALGALETLDQDMDVNGVVVAEEQLLSTKFGEKAVPELIARGLEVIPGQHPYPGSGSFLAGNTILEYVKKAQGECLFLISGGASSLAELNCEGFPRKDVRGLYRGLVRSGADIHEINTVRKHISYIKGGRLALHFKGKKMVNLVISDVMGSSLDTIGSGPTYPDREDSTFDRSREILGDYGLLKTLSPAAKDFFNRTDEGSETPKALPNAGIVEHHILMSNEKLVRGLVTDGKLRFQDKPVTIREIAKPYQDSSWTVESLVESFVNICKNAPENTFSTGFNGDSIMYVAGGEPTIRVEGDGIGGRAQHTALTFLREIIADRELRERMEGTTFVAFATDGRDGSSPAAGCIVDGELIRNFHEGNGIKEGTGFERLAEEVEQHLENYDSYSFFRRYRSSIITGRTGTNVLDVYLLY